MFRKLLEAVQKMNESFSIRPGDNSVDSWGTGWSGWDKYWMLMAMTEVIPFDRMKKLRTYGIVGPEEAKAIWEHLYKIGEDMFAESDVMPLTLPKDSDQGEVYTQMFGKPEENKQITSKEFRFFLDFLEECEGFLVSG